MNAPTDWQARAACRSEDPALFFRSSPAAAVAICGRCAVRPECLYDALTIDPFQYGVFGGLSSGQRRELPALPDDRAAALAVLDDHLTAMEMPVTIDALRRIQDEADPTPAPTPVPRPRPATTPANAPAEERTTAVAEPASPTATATADAAVLPEFAAMANSIFGTGEVTVAQLLAWGDAHADEDVQAQSARARASLTGLQNRKTADEELATITSEADQLEARLQELRARQAELQPTTKKATAKARKTTPRDYVAAEVRAWAAQAGVECPPLGRVPSKVVDAWRAATQGSTS